MISSKQIDISVNISNSKNPNEAQTHSNHIAFFEGNYNDFFQQYLICNKPVLISNVSSHWKCSRLWVKNGLPNIEYLRTSYGRPISFFLLKNYYFTYWIFLFKEKQSSALRIVMRNILMRNKSAIWNFEISLITGWKSWIIKIYQTNLVFTWKWVSILIKNYNINKIYELNL